MYPAINRAVIYTHKMREMTDFYTGLFGYEAIERDGDRLIELRPSGDGLTLLLHPAGKGQKHGQSLVKLVFDVMDVEGFRALMIEQGFEFGPIHAGDGYVFANGKDPSSNGLSISSRAFASFNQRD